MDKRRIYEINNSKSYMLLGFIFYLLGSLGWLLSLYFLYITNWLQSPPFNIDFNINIWPITLPIAIFSSLTVGFTIWSWITYTNISREKIYEARTATLILGIFGIILAWVIGGIFILLTYSKLGEVIEYSTSPDNKTYSTLSNCKYCGKPIQSDSKFCEHCGKEVD